MKELSYFVNQYHQLPGELLVKQIVRVTNLGALSLVLNAIEWKSMSGLIKDPPLTMKQLQMVTQDPDTQHVFHEEMVSLVDWIKVTIRSAYPEKEDHPIPSASAK